MITKKKNTEQEFNKNVNVGSRKVELCEGDKADLYLLSSVELGRRSCMKEKVLSLTSSV